MRTSFFILSFFCVTGVALSQTENTVPWESLKKEFKKTKSDEAFCQANSDHPYVIDKISSAYYLDAHLYDSLTHKNIGDVAGPFVSNTWLNEDPNVEKSTFILKLVKVDSCYEIRVRHILFEGKDIQERERNRHTADSLLQKIKAGTPFETVARKYGHDGTEFSGGDLGWFKQGSMVKAFDAACFSAKKGDLFTVETPFGLHIVKISEDKRIRVCNYYIVPVVKSHKQ